MLTVPKPRASVNTSGMSGTGEPGLGESRYRTEAGKSPTEAISPAMVNVKPVAVANTHTRRSPLIPHAAEEEAGMIA
jgi:hypothetical protein